MKKLLYIGLAAAAGLAFFACSKDTSKGTDTPEESTGKLVTITASIPEEGLATKVSFAEDETTLRLTKIAWEAGDVLDIAGKTFTIVDASISTDGKTASFTGEEPAAASSYTVKYNSIASKGIDLNAQEQEANGSTKHLGYSIVVEASDYKTVSFENATSQSSVLQLRAKLPDGIKDDVKKVIFKSNLAVFNGEKQLTVALADGRTGDDNLLNVYATLPAGPVTIPSTEKMELLIQFQVGADYEKYTAYREFASDKEFIKDGAAQYIGIDCSNIESYAGKNDDGTSSHPYLIGDKYQLKAMSGRLETTKTYFKLVDDIDMTNEAWTSLNASLDKIVALDGNNKGITHLSAPLFDDLNGEVKDLTIKDATVVAGNKITGILANTVKTGASTIENVDITGTGSSTSSVKASNYTGGLIGEIDASNTSIEGCDVTNTNVSGTLAGGVVGYANALVTMSYCTYSGGTVTASERYAAGFIGSVADNASVISDCSVSDASVKASKDRVGGFVGQFQTKATVKNSNVTDVNVESALSGQATNIGGFVGVQYGTCENCHVYGNSTVSTSNSTKNQQVNIGGFGGFIRGHASGCSTVATIGSESKLQIGSHVGGFAGILTNNSQGKGKLTKCFSSGNIYSSDRYIGGLVGKTEDVDPISMCYSISNVIASDNCGGLVGWVGNAIEISDSYATGDVKATGQRGGGLIGLVETTSNVTIRRCYASGDVSEKFSNGGLICRISNATCTVVNCAAWNSSVYASANGSGNWSTGAVVGVAFPKCTLTDNYRNPNMALTAYWVPASNFQHANVSASHPLTDSTGAEMTDSSTASGQPHYPQYPYHGKVEAGKTLSQLASTILGWDSNIWDFTGDLPKLIDVN